MKFTSMLVLTTMLFCITTGPANCVFSNASGCSSPKTTVTSSFGSRKCFGGTKIQSGFGGSWLETSASTAKPSCVGSSGAQPT